MLVLVKSKTNKEKNGEIMRNTKSALRISILAIAALTLSVSTSGSVSAAVKAGAACTKAGQKSGTFTCTKVGTKLVWKANAVKPAAPVKSEYELQIASWLKDCNNTISVIIGYGAGGATDIWVRNKANFIQTMTGAKVNVTNLPGAGGSLGITKVTSAKRNGCTIGNVNLPSALQYLRPTSSVTYNKESINFIATSGFSSNALVVNADSKYKTVADLIAAAKAAPGKINAGSDGPGSDDAIAYYDVETKAGIKLNQVVLDGSAAKVTALLSNQIDFFGGSVTGVLPQLTNKQFRALCVYTDKAVKFIPDVPTCTSQGLAVISTNLWSLMMAQGVDEKRRQAIEDLMIKIAETPAYIASADKLGVETRVFTSDALSEEWTRQAVLYKGILAKI
jgi:tripartite-type tricarboxylate transporter receptor subunit TctC